MVAFYFQFYICKTSVNFLNVVKKSLQKYVLDTVKCSVLRKLSQLTLSQTSPGFHMSAV